MPDDVQTHPALPASRVVAPPCIHHWRSRALRAETDLETANLHLAAYAELYSPAPKETLP